MEGLITVARIKCWHCKDTHASVKEVRECYREIEGARLDAEAEHAADLANERSFEDRGYWENAAFEDWENRNGVVGYEDARDMWAAATA